MTNIYGAGAPTEDAPPDLHGNQIVKVVMTIDEINDFHKDNRLRSAYDLNRGHVWNSNLERNLLSSIHAGVDIPKIYQWIDSGENGNDFPWKGNDKKSRRQLGREVIKTIKERSITVGILDGFQRITSIVKYLNGEIRTPTDLMIDGKEVGASYFKDMDEKEQKRFKLTEIDVTILIGDRSQANDYFQRLNSGVSLTQIERTNAYDTPISNYVRVKANIHSPNEGKLKIFKTMEIEGKVTNVSKLLQIDFGNRMKSDKLLKQCIAYSMAMNGCLRVSDMGSKCLEKVSTMVIEDLNKVSVEFDPNEPNSLRNRIWNGRVKKEDETQST